MDPNHGCICVCFLPSPVTCPKSLLWALCSELPGFSTSSHEFTTAFRETEVRGISGLSLQAFPVSAQPLSLCLPLSSFLSFSLPPCPSFSLSLSLPSFLPFLDLGLSSPGCFGSSQCLQTDFIYSKNILLIHLFIYCFSLLFSLFLGSISPATLL